MKKILIFSLILLLLALSVYSAPFSCGIDYPKNNGVIGNSTEINVTFVTSATNDSVNVSFFFTSEASTPTRNNSISSGLAGNISNTTKVNVVNQTLNNVVLEDGTYTVDCSCVTQGVGVACNSTRTGVVVDRTKPAPVTSITFTNPIKKDDTITATVNRALANKCFIRFGTSSVETKAMTLSGSTCTFTVGVDNPPNGVYKAFLSAHDGLNESSLSDPQEVNILARTGDGGGLWGGTLVMNEPQGGQSASSQNPFTPQKNDKATLALVLVILAFLYFRNKK